MSLGGVGAKFEARRRTGRKVWTQGAGFQGVAVGGREGLEPRHAPERVHAAGGGEDCADTRSVLETRGRGGGCGLWGGVGILAGGEVATATAAVHRLGDCGCASGMGGASCPAPG